jgi:hypothetical protein
MQFLLTKARFLVINVFFTFLVTLSAQDFEVAPVLVSFTANPGETQTRELTITNHGNEVNTFNLSLNDYTVDEQGTKEALAAGSTDRTLADWLTVNPSYVTLNPNETATASLILTVPRTAFNTRWGMIGVEVAKEQLASQADKQLATGVVIVPRIVVLVKQSPPSNRNFSGKVSGLKEVKNPNIAFRSFEAILENTGDKILDAKVFLALANLQTAEEKQYQSKSLTIYPQQKRKMVLVLPENPPPGEYALAFLMDYGENSSIEGAQILLNIE